MPQTQYHRGSTADGRSFMGIEIETYFDEPTFYMARLSNLGLVLWRETPVLACVTQVAATLEKLEPVPGQGFALMAVITAKCAPIGADIRSVVDDGMRAHRSAALAMAAVIEVPGVFGGLTRAIARTMSVISRTPYPVNTYGSVADAAAWLPSLMASRGAPEVPASRIVEAIDAARRPRP
ncbi:MAG: hypothetical protein KDK70_06345 [Myxococcales bacterium]|nr:hypothetical protein [Myxococcales bacterium]